ncbi:MULTISPECIES: NADP-dependent oxidoreductase [unclassified Pseudomonas]|uniref:NADP-dependent oxidoreductase n=1 Tax=unclassified Pseudomonas TaxID=196821 RepID=UPI002AC90A7C|nr:MULTISPECIES: NADP-dependent oxidoreductase [unclassified Pseudomonas]MEB0040128.1 NADP-dependent oxidoreductase [Pseudomonas sp. MH10]MEB0122533.1 NADP-dependent oxidoreductase [Pseudomonas sp. CCI1.2]WPX65464.1 NADP-dependent oxidoreductase [Pseudomonas sp. MH10]
MQTMKAVRIETFGGPEVIQIKQVPIPEAASGELLIRVVAAGVNPVDYKIREGKYPVVKADKLPLTLGREVAGIVEHMGSSALGMKEGDRVIAMIGADGGYAEFARVKAEYACKVPEDIDLLTAATVPLAAHTAWQALFSHGHLKEGQQVLIHGGSGGVGHFAVQFAKAHGAKVFATGSQKSLAFIQSLGADRVIDHDAERFEEVCADLDLVIDLVGGETQRRSWAVLREGGILVSTLEEPKQDIPEASGKSGVRFTTQPSGLQLAEIVALISAGKVKPALYKTFPLDNAKQAQQFLEHEHVEGKIVLEVKTF